MVPYGALSVRDLRQPRRSPLAAGLSVGKLGAAALSVTFTVAAPDPAA